jgi:signal recognition particle subunit SRP54
MDSSIG